MSKTKLTDDKLKQFIKSGGRKGALPDFDKFVNKVAKVNKKLDK